MYFTGLDILKAGVVAFGRFVMLRIIEILREEPEISQETATAAARGACGALIRRNTCPAAESGRAFSI